MTYLLSLFLRQFVIDIIFDCGPGALVNYRIPEWHLQEVGYHWNQVSSVAQGNSNASVIFSCQQQQKKSII